MQVAALIGLGLGQVNRRQNPCSICRNASNLIAFSHVCLTGEPNGGGNAYLAGEARCVTRSSQPKGHGGSAQHAHAPQRQFAEPQSAEPQSPERQSQTAIP